MYFLIKLGPSAGLIVLISELAKRGGWTAVLRNFANNLALGYSLALCGYARDATSRCAFYRIFWLVLPSLSFFIALPCLLRMRMDFWLSLAIALVIIFSCYLLMMALLKKIGVQP